jgi:hypothetical protein
MSTFIREQIEKFKKFDYKINENNQFYNPNKETMDRLEKNIETKINNINFDLTNWIYNNIIRTSNPSDNVEFKEWVVKNENNFKKMCDNYIERYNKNNDLIEARTDKGEEWFGINFNTKFQIHKNKKVRPSANKINLIKNINDLLITLLLLVIVSHIMACFWIFISTISL